MKLKKLILSIVLILILATPGHALFWRSFTSLTGEVAGSVDNAPCTAADGAYSLGNDTDDGIGLVQTSDGKVYSYLFDRSATDATSSPTYIRCKSSSFVEGVWILQWASDQVLKLSGGILTGDVNFMDGTTHSPVTMWTDETGQWIQMYKADAADFYIFTDQTTNSSVSMVNSGAGNMNLVVEGTVSEGGTSLVNKYQPLENQRVSTTNDVSFATISFTSDDLTGTHTGADDAATLTDSTASFTPDSLIGFSIENTTDGSDGIITDNDATTVTATLAGGTGNDWDNGDAYVIGIHGGAEIDLYPNIDLRCEFESGATVQVDTSPGFGGLLSQSTDFNWDSADADSDATPAVAIHCDPFGNTGVSKIMFRGHIRNDSWNWTQSSAVTWIYLGTDGLPTQTQPSGTGDIVQIIGVATSADTFYFNPSYYFNKLN